MCIRRLASRLNPFPQTRQVWECSAVSSITSSSTISKSSPSVSGLGWVPWEEEEEEEEERRLAPLMMMWWMAEVNSAEIAWEWVLDRGVLALTELDRM